MATIESRPHTRPAWEPSLLLEDMIYRWLAFKARWLTRKIRTLHVIDDEDIKAAATHLGRQEAAEFNQAKSKAAILAELGFTGNSPDEKSK